MLAFSDQQNDKPLFLKQLGDWLNALNKLNDIGKTKKKLGIIEGVDLFEDESIIASAAYTINHLFIQLLTSVICVDMKDGDFDILNSTNPSVSRMKLVNYV